MKSVKLKFCGLWKTVGPTYDAWCSPFGWPVREWCII